MRLPRRSITYAQVRVSDIEWSNAPGTCMSVLEAKEWNGSTACKQLVSVYPEDCKTNSTKERK